MLPYEETILKYSWIAYFSLVDIHIILQCGSGSLRGEYRFPVQLYRLSTFCRTTTVTRLIQRSPRSLFPRTPSSLLTSLRSNLHRRQPLQIWLPKGCLTTFCCICPFKTAKRMLLRFGLQDPPRQVWLLPWRDKCKTPQAKQWGVWNAGSKPRIVLQSRCLRQEEDYPQSASPRPWWNAGTRKWAYDGEAEAACHCSLYPLIIHK